MRRLIVLLWLAATGCRGLLGIDDPTLGSDASSEGAADSTVLPDAPSCGTADWDLDGKADGCDPCPMFADPALDHDTDGDGIGDGCDPDPSTPGDTRGLWVGFHTIGDINTWTTATGTWGLSGGALVQSDVNAVARIDVPGTWSNVYVMTEVDITGKGASPPQVGFCANVGTATYKCCDVGMPSSPQLLTWSELNINMNAWAGTVDVGSRIALTNRALSASHTCVVSQMTGIPTMGKLIEAASPGKIAFHLRDLSVAYRYLFVVQIGP